MIFTTKKIKLGLKNYRLCKNVLHNCYEVAMLLAPDVSLQRKFLNKALSNKVHIAPLSCSLKQNLLKLSEYFSMANCVPRKYLLILK